MTKQDSLVTTFSLKWKVFLYTGKNYSQSGEVIPFVFATLEDLLSFSVRTAPHSSVVHVDVFYN